MPQLQPNQQAPQAGARGPAASQPTAQAPGGAQRPVAPQPQAGTRPAPSFADVVAGAGTLEPGMAGEAVTDVQARLTRLGFGTPVSGSFQPATVQTVSEFQKAYGLPATGRVDQKTAAALVKADMCSVTLEQFLQLFQVDAARAGKELRGLNPSMYLAGLTTVERKAAYLAQIGHESGGLQWFEEFASGADYEGRRDLGNNQAGDGKKFKGRGAIQVTGRANYREASGDLAGMTGGADLEKNPGRAKDDDMKYLVAAWFWQKRGLNEHADAGQFDSITRRINGGTNGKADRDKRHQQALKVLRAG
ncbi:MAG: peptidoglycan-binding protein [Myxococcales bacterium]|nr:peptidoglycan-binding protein [Myxococcales bacterium]